MPEQLTLYGFKLSPFSEKIHLALTEAGIPHTYCDVDLFNRPDWFNSKVSATGKVPTITYGGPEVAPEDPSPLSTRILESNVILEFIADAYPESGLMPKDPVARAQVRFFIEAVNKLCSTLMGFSSGREPVDGTIKAIEAIQDLLTDSAEFAMGDKYTIADACVIPFLDRLLLFVKTDIGKFPVGEGFKLGEVLKDPKYAKFMAYAARMMERPATKAIWDEELIKTLWATRLYVRQ
ncbi:thioredoxin-like protein [Phlebopus sp. FC_14]|nr:thioredoxin-like protein [Phlebopus sp. FC_14]